MAELNRKCNRNLWKKKEEIENLTEGIVSPVSLLDTSRTRMLVVSLPFFSERMPLDSH
jgi:hypothetical protein